MHKPTHKLIKEFKVSREENYAPGTLAAIPKRHKKHEGFCCNVFFLDEKGEFLENSTGAMAWFDKSFFKPFKEWFEEV